MKRLLGGIDAISEWSGKILSALITVIIVIIVLEIISRYILNAPTNWVHELSQHLFGAYAIMGGAYVLLHQHHIKIDLIYGGFSPRTRAAFDSVTYLMFFLFVVVLLVNGWQFAFESLQVKEFSPTSWGPPRYPLKLTIPVGAFLMLLQGLAHFIRALNTAIRGEIQ